MKQLLLLSFLIVAINCFATIETTTTDYGIKKYQSFESCNKYTQIGKVKGVELGLTTKSFKNSELFSENDFAYENEVYAAYDVRFAGYTWDYCKINIYNSYGTEYVESINFYRTTEHIGELDSFYKGIHEDLSNKYLYGKSTDGCYMYNCELGIWSEMNLYVFFIYGATDVKSNFNISISNESLRSKGGEIRQYISLSYTDSECLRLQSNKNKSEL